MFLHKASRAQVSDPGNILSDTWAHDISDHVLPLIFHSAKWEWRKNNHHNVFQRQDNAHHCSHINKDREHGGLVANNFQERQGASACSKHKLPVNHSEDWELNQLLLQSLEGIGHRFPTGRENGRRQPRKLMATSWSTWVIWDHKWKPQGQGCNQGKRLLPVQKENDLDNIWSFSYHGGLVYWCHFYMFKMELKSHRLHIFLYTGLDKES